MNLVVVQFSTTQHAQCSRSLNNYRNEGRIKKDINSRLEVCTKG